MDRFRAVSTADRRLTEGVATLTRLVIDADLNKRLATELSRRGIDAVSVSELQVKGFVDPRLLAHLHGLYGVDVVLVTADDHMPLEHATIIAELRCTIAVVDPNRESEIGLDAHRRNIVHRYAEAMAVQTLGTIVRYGTQKRIWTKPRRQKREQQHDRHARAAPVMDTTGQGTML